MKLKSTFLRYGIAAALLLAISAQWYNAQSYSTGAPTSYTNAPSDYGNCTSCHSSTFTISSNITLTGATGNVYLPGKKYTMKVEATLSGSTRKGGFQVTVLDSAGNKWAGPLKSTASNTQRDTSTTLKRVYITHKSPQSASSSKVSWTFDWVAPAKGTKTVYFYIAVNDANGDGSDAGDKIIGQKIAIREGTLPTANFTFTPSTVCLGDTLFLKDASTGNPTSWKWSSLKGTFDNASSQNPKVTYNTSGIDTISLVATNALGSSTVVKKAVTIYSLPGDSIAIMKGSNLLAATSASICPGDSIQLFASPGSTFIWSTGATSRSIYAKAATTYSVTVTNAGGCSTTSRTFTLSNYPALAKPTLSFSPNKSIFCAGDSFTVLSTPDTAAASYSFMMDSTLLASGTVDSVSLVSKGDNVIHDFMVTLTSRNGCKASSSSLKALTPERPVAAFSYTVNNNTVEFINNSTKAGSYLWSFGDSLNSMDTSTSPTFTYNKSGIYRVMLTARNAPGCTDTVSKLVTFILTALRSEESGKITLALYPNPVQETIRFSQNSLVGGQVTMIIRNSKGIEVNRTERRLISGFNQISISCEMLPAGIYFLQVKGAENYPVVKFIKK